MNAEPILYRMVPPDLTGNLPAGDYALAYPTPDGAILCRVHLRADTTLDELAVILRERRRSSAA